MNKKRSPHFILIDDDPLNNLICSKVIRITVPGAVVKAFTDAETGLKYIQSTYSENKANRAILLLDINMPSLTGWDVLDRFKNFTDRIKEHIKIFMLSSSIHSSDKEKASQNQFVSGYISKPLSQNILLGVLQ